MRRLGRAIIERLLVWPWFCALAAAIFLVRAVFLMSVLPPLEGWDEYQHLGYVAYITETGRDPVLFPTSYVPRSLYPELVRYPHSNYGAEQLGRIGARSYAQFWKASPPPAVLPDAPAMGIYQAQQAPLYYRFAALPWAMLPSGAGLLARVTLLRAVNVLFGAATVFLIGLALGRLVAAGPHRYVMLLMVALQPLLLMDCARVANDALAVLLGTVVVYSLLVIAPRRWLLAAVGGGVALGLAILAKAFNLCLVPFVPIVFAHFAWQRRITVRQAVIGSSILLAIAVAITFDHFHFNLVQFGSLTPMQEAVRNAGAGVTSNDFLRVVGEIDWGYELSRRYLRHSLWVGAWSLVGTSRFLVQAHQVLICLALLGGAFAACRRTRGGESIFRDSGTGMRMGMLGLCFAAGVVYHMLHIQLACGYIGTNIWYAMVSLPWLLCLVYVGFSGYRSSWVTYALASGMLLTQFSAEVYGVLGRMVPTYTGEAWGDIARQRLARLHLAGVGPELTVPMLAVLVGLLGIAGIVAWFAVDRVPARRKKPGLFPNWLRGGQETRKPAA